MAFTAADVPDQTGRTIVVTGTTNGIGFETTRELVCNGATVVMPCRSPDRYEAAADDGLENVSDADLCVEQCDLADLESVRAFAGRLAEPIDGLINNAGTMAIPRAETTDGFETQFGVTHFGHFALTGLLLENLLAKTDDAPEARVVTVSSGLHERGTIDFDDLHGERSYDSREAYPQSKLATVLFAYELERRFHTADAIAASLAVHPGYADPNLQFRGLGDRASRLERAARRLMNALLAQSPERGALPTLYAATAPDAERGGYYGPGSLASMRGGPERHAPSDLPSDRDLARRRWRSSGKETGVAYDLPRPAVVGSS